jgi:TorA maturation chaperone TorD
VSSLNNNGREATIAFPLSPFPLPELDLARVRQVMYQLFGSLFLYPNGDRLANVQTAAQALQKEDDLWSAFPFHPSWLRLLDRLATLPAGENVSIEEEYVQLFSVNPKAIPNESVYINPEGGARGLIIAHLEEEYTVAGLAVSPAAVESPDHIAVELEFMAFLCDREVEAWETGDDEAAERVHQQQHEFLNKHLKKWFPGFARSTKAANPVHLYGLVIEAAFAFLHHELDLFRVQ